MDWHAQRCLGSLSTTQCRAGQGADRLALSIPDAVPSFRSPRDARARREEIANRLRDEVVVSSDVGGRWGGLLGRLGDAAMSCDAVKGQSDAAACRGEAAGCWGETVACHG